MDLSSLLFRLQRWSPEVTPLLGVNVPLLLAADLSWRGNVLYFMHVTLQSVWWVMNTVRGSTHWHTHSFFMKLMANSHNFDILQKRDIASTEQLITSGAEENKPSRHLVVLQKWPADCSRARWLFTLFIKYPEFFLYIRAWVCSECTAHCKQVTDWKHGLCRGQYTTTACNHHHHHHHHHPDEYIRVWQQLFLTGRDESPRHHFSLLNHFHHRRWIKIIHWNLILHYNVLRQLVICDVNNILEP